MRLNDSLSRVYNVWLLCVVFRVAYGYITEGGGRSLFEQHLFGHTLMCGHLHATYTPPARPSVSPLARPLHARCTPAARPLSTPPLPSTRCVASICSTHVLGAVFMLMLIYYPNYYHDA